MKKLLLFGALALAVGCGQSVSSPSGVKTTKAPTLLPPTVDLSQTVTVSDSQYQTMQRGGRGIGGRGFVGRGFAGRGFGRFGGRYGRFSNRFFGYGGLNYPIYGYGGSYYPDYFDPYTYGAGAYRPLYSTPLFNYPSYAAPYGSYNLPYLSSGCCNIGMQGVALYNQILPPLDALKMGYVPSTVIGNTIAPKLGEAREAVKEAVEEARED